MPFRLPAALMLPLILGPAFAADERPPIRFEVEPPEQDSQVVPPSIPLVSPATPPHSRLDLPPLSPSLLSFTLLDTLETGKQPFDFSEYWAQVEKENGIDDLRRRMGMAGVNSNVPSALPEGTRSSGLNLMGAGVLLYQAWKAHEDKAARERRFRLKVGGLIDLANRLEDRKGASPGINLIVAKLDFMGKRVTGKLPNRPERRRFTENLKAWAVNPVFDSTGLGPALMEVCRLYEEYEP